MVNFPERTVFNRRIPKKKFYEHLYMSNKLESQFSKEIEVIYWKNKLSSETLNISAGKNVTEIEIFEIILKEQFIGRNIIEVIDRQIPYHIVFILVYKDFAQIWISFKENSRSCEGKFKVDGYYKTDWMKYEELSLEIEGLDLDKVYENFIIQVAGEKLSTENGENIKNAITRAKEKEKLERSIKDLENKIQNEKQFNHQVKLMGDLRSVKAELNALRASCL